MAGFSIPGIGKNIRSIFKGGADKHPRTDTGKPRPQDICPGYPVGASKEDRLLWIANRFYKEGSFEKIQFSRKWMRNILIFQGYHELEWSEVNVAWDALIRDSGDYAFPNNFYRTQIKNGASMMVQQEPKIEIAPANGDFDAASVAKASESAFKIIKENVNYDYLRVIEALYLRIFGNSFRYSYYSLDPRYGHISAPVYSEKNVTVGNGQWGPCPNCQAMGEGMPNVCPNCGKALPQVVIQPPLQAKVPEKVGEVSYPKGQEKCEVVSPMQCGTRSSSANLMVAPYFYRARVVDRLALQSDFPDVDIMTQSRLGNTNDSGGDAYAAAADLSLIYEQSLADLPGDPTQYAAWYERATSYAKALFLQMWLRPAQYFFDDELKEEFPDGAALDIVDNGVLLESRNESMDDHWVHFGWNHVPGRFWWDGDDDLIPGQLKLNETDRLFMRNQAYNSVPQKVVDKQRIDVDQIVNDPEELIVVKLTGRPVAEAIMNLEGQQLPQECWQWRATQIEEMQYHSGVFPTAIGAHQPGVNTFGGQETAVNRGEMAMSPMLLVFKEGNELWVRQMLKIVANNWLDDRVQVTQGIFGQMEFKKLRGRMLQLDKVKVTAAVLPVDYTEQQSFSSAVAAGVLNPQDPRVIAKALELYDLPQELNSTNTDIRVQWDEIEMMKQGQQVVPVLFRDNDDIHIEICRQWMLSDEARKGNVPPEVVQAVYQHMFMHMNNRIKSMQLQTLMAAEAGGGQPQQGQPQQPQQGQPQSQGRPTQQNPQAGKHGGQVPTQAAARQKRAAAGAKAKPNRPQPPGGNQYRTGPRGTSPGRGR